jgi:hypothetical protein
VIAVCDRRRPALRGWRVAEDIASALLGLDDVRVAGVEDDLDGGLRVYVVSTAALVACPACGVPWAAVKGWVTTRPGGCGLR